MNTQEPGTGLFYRRWILANGWAESAGLGTTFIIGHALAPLIGSATGAVSVLTTAVVAIVFGTLLEGVVVGAAQEHVLRDRVCVRPWSWAGATAMGAGLAWLLGMVPSTVLALNGSESAAPAAEPSAVVQLVLAAGLGIVAGPILGVAQWLVLRRLVAHAARWLWANAVAWAVGMPLIFAGMDMLPWDGNAAGLVLSLYALCFVTGTVVGAVHGRVLVKLTDVRQERAEPAA